MSAAAVHLEHHHHHVEVSAHAKGPHHVLRDVLDALLLLLLAAGTLYLWPANFGGNTHIIVVQGHSMEPRYHIGDALVVKPLPHPKVGDIMVFAIPEGEAGAGINVVHRVYRIREDGSYQTKGDNRETPDNWHITDKDVLGRPIFLVPQAGTVVGWFRSTTIISLCVFLIVLIWIWPTMKYRLHDVHLLKRRDYPSREQHMANARDEIEELWTKLLTPPEPEPAPVRRPMAPDPDAAFATSAATPSVAGIATDDEWVRWFDQYVAAEDAPRRRLAQASSSGDR